ncbi:PRC-barrel domain-containing protein [Candidatus Nitrospira bockiana]
MKKPISGICAVSIVLLSATAWAGGGQASGQMPGGQPSGSHQPGSLDMTGTKDPTPSDFAVLPLARGEKKEVRNHELVGDEIKGKDGQPIGHLEKLIMDTKTGKIEYGVVQFKETKELWPFPWNSFKISREGEVSLNLTKDQWQQKTSLDDAKDLSPDVKKLVKEMQKGMGEPVVNPEGLGVTKQPASAGGQGEEQVGGAGPSGTRGLPPSGAPQYEGEDKKSGH